MRSSRGCEVVADAGDVYLADLNDEVRRSVLVLSNSRFHALAGRAFVAPAASPRRFPWRIDHDESTFAVDLLQSVSTDRLLERTGRVPQGVLRRARVAVHHITL